MKLLVAVKALIVNDGKVLVLREADYGEGTNQGKWDVPGGRIDSREMMLDALNREVKEECGLIVQNSRILDVIESFQTIKEEEYHIVRVYYQVEPVTFEVTLSEEHDQYQWIDMQNEVLEKKEFVSGLRGVFDKVSV